MGKKVTRLYEQFQPEHYRLHLVTDRETMAFSGTVTVRGKKVGRPAQRLTFHQKELKITSASIVKHDKKGDQPVEVSRINNQDSFDEVRLHSKDMIYPGEYTVTMKFEGNITRPMNGIYPCYFKHDGQDKILIATQFESHHAREAFPNIDEPEAKATFDLSLTTPAGETVIANTPVKTQKKTGKNLVTTFETTPRMSSYLLAFVYGEMGYKETKSQNGTAIRAYATPSNVGLLEHGLNVAKRGLEFFEDYFGVPYPLAKLDIVALPDFSVGAMENWGLITFRETTMLADPKTSSIESKQLVALVIAHELSHQWFGNLVTMKWWDDLWLNESFANLMEYRAVDALYPEWQIWEMFVSSETGAAKRRDSLADVQAIKTEVQHPDEIGSLFDPSIVYAKGGTVLHMLMRYIGEEAFRQGLKLYFDKHRYGNTVAADLWEALGQSSGQDISGFMADWVKRPGYPLVTVDWQPGQPQAKLQQQRFLSDPSVNASDDKPWQVPLAATYSLDPPLLRLRNGQAKIISAGDEPLLLNHDGASYFLPRYAQAEHLAQIVKGIAHGQVSNIDRLLLLDNYTMLQRGGITATTESLDLLRGYANERSESVWGSIAVALGEARKLLERDETTEALLDTILQAMVLPLTRELGWDDGPNDSAQTLRLRGLAYAMAAGSKTPTIIDEGLKRFAAFKQPADLPPSTRSTIYYIGVRYGTDADFQKVLELHNTIQNADEKDELAGSLTGAKSPKRYRQLVKLLKTKHIRRQDMIHWFVWLLRNRYSRPDTWQWLLDNWSWIEQEFGSDKRYSDFARYPGSIFSHQAEFDQYKTFFEPKKSVVAMTRDIALAEQEIASRVAWRQRNEASVKQWLKKHSQ
ncbi:MAG TPA: M1 family metallopeptidase [Candidatus Saccharimonadales bacterium]|jgi:aminopeptidase N|nr:M1 family metallopeptidase [Candidatus Saccharimonadales bacterium]